MTSTTSGSRSSSGTIDSPREVLKGADKVNPFPGPKPYNRHQRDVFFGRRRAVEELTSLVLSSSIVLVHAPSGSGKSSLLEAGLFPRLADFNVNIMPPVRFSLIRSGHVEPNVWEDSPHEPSDAYSSNPFISLLELTLFPGENAADGSS